MLVTFLMPWSNFCLSRVPRREGLPPWEPWLESWYNLFDPAVWEVLAEDDKKDIKAFDWRARTLNKLEARGKLHLPHARKLDEQYHAINNRRFHRFCRLYALHDIRLACQSKKAAGRSARTADAHPPALLCPFKPGSVWPAFAAHEQATSAAIETVFSPARPDEPLDFLLPEVMNDPQRLPGSAWAVDTYLPAYTASTLPDYSYSLPPSYKPMAVSPLPWRPTPLVDPTTTSAAQTKQLLGSICGLERKGRNPRPAFNGGSLTFLSRWLS